MIKPQAGILDITPYRAGKSRINGRSDVLKLSSNENPLGPPLGAIEAYKASAQNLHLYPSSDHGTLRAAIGRKNGLASEQIICGAGSDELIAFLCQAFSGLGDEVIHTEHGFAMYRISALGAGARPVVARERERCVDVDAILAALSARTRLIFIANPGNPTGRMVEAGDLRRLATSLPKDVLLVLDGAYAEYVENFDGGIGLARDFSNVFMLRTFSKFYGLGGLRVGWGYGAPEIIDVLNRIRGPFNLGHGQIAAAIAALDDSDFSKKIFAENIYQRGRLRDILMALGIACDPSEANFILPRFCSSEQAKAADRHLQNDDIIVRSVRNYGLGEALRITIGNEAMVDRVCKSLTVFMKEQG